MSEDAYVYTVDRTDSSSRLFGYLDGPLPDHLQTKWHRENQCRTGVAACSWRIVLNTEDRTRLGSVAAPVPEGLCRRCFRRLDEATP